MKGYAIVELNNMIDELGEDKTKKFLSEFSCPLNPDVEKFLKRNAMEFTKQGISRTHLIITQYQGKNVLIGYFTLAFKYFTIKSNANLSKTLKSKISKFGTYEKELKCHRIPAPLIAQLGKNFTNGYNRLITGDELLKLACDKVALVQEAIGGKVVYLECEDKPKLIDFYTGNGFVIFDKRKLDKDELDDLDGEYLIQLLKIHSNKNKS